MAGDKVKKGIYQCVICGFQIDAEHDEDLELCPLCDGARFEELSDL
jgi:rubrerythrin